MKNVFPFLHAFAVLLLLGTTAIAATRYVKPTAAGSGDGSSWANASASLQDMIDASVAGDAVWVAAGTYKPAAYPTGCTDCASTRDYAFALKDGVSVYGGFAGTETALSQRNFTTNTTILSGDIGTENDISDNCFHVVVAAFVDVIPTSRLDGFTITRGNANRSISITVNGISVLPAAGGGVFTNGGTITLANNTLSNNSAADSGGGILTYESNSTLSNNTLVENTAAGGGGGMYTYKGTNILTNNTLIVNVTTFGGGIYTNNGSNTITNNILWDNVANNGGGVCTEGGTNMLANNTLLANSADIGGGLYTRGGSNTFTNNIFWDNKSGGDAGVASAAYYATNVNDNTLKNNLLQLAASNYPVSNTGNYAIGAAATDNIFATDPLFVDAADIDGPDNLLRTDDDGLRLQSTSPAINMGTNTGAPATDISGNARIVGGTADMGAYEYNGPTAISQPHATPFVLWPTPAHDQLCVTAPNTANAGLYDLHGRAIRSFMLVEGTNTLNISELTAGVYMLRIGGAAVKVVKE